MTSIADMKFIIIVLLSMDILVFPNRSFAQEAGSIDSVQRLVDKIVKELDRSLNMNKQLMWEKTALEKEIEELTSSNQTLQEKFDGIKKKEFDFLTLEKRLEEYETKITQDEAKIEELIKSNKTLEEKLLETSKDFQLKLGSYTAKNNQLQESLNDHLVRLTQSEAKIKELEQLKIPLEEKLKACETKTVQDENKILELTETNQKLEKTLEAYNDLQKELDSYKAVNSQLQNDLEGHQVKLTQSNTKIDELEQLKNSLEEKLGGYKMQVAEDENKISDLQKDLKEYGVELAQSNSKIEELEKQLQTNQSQKDELKNSMENQIQELKDNLFSRDKEIENYKMSLAEVENKNEQLANQTDAQRKKMFDSFYQAGRAYTLGRKYKEALINFQECLKINPDNANVHYNLGILYQHEYGDRVSAIRHLEKYLELKPQAKDKKEIELLLGLLSSTPDKN